MLFYTSDFISDVLTALFKPEY